MIRVNSNRSRNAHALIDGIAKQMGISMSLLPEPDIARVTTKINIVMTDGLKTTAMNVIQRYNVNRILDEEAGQTLLSKPGRSRESLLQQSEGVNRRSVCVIGQNC